MDKFIKYAPLVGLLLLALYVFFGGQAARLAGMTNFDQLTLDTPFSGDDALTVSSTQVINASAQWVGAGVTIGASGSPLTKLVCGSRDLNLGSIATNGTSTIDVTVSGIAGATSTKQVLWGTFASSSAGSEVFIEGVVPSSTNVATAVIKNIGPAVDLAGMGVYVCGIQF